MQVKLTKISYIETLFQEEFEDIKGVINICKLKDRQHNGQKKKVFRVQLRQVTLINGFI